MTRVMPNYSSDSDNSFDYGRREPSGQKRHTRSWRKNKAAGTNGIHKRRQKRWSW